jgi:hypothetical protein
MVDTDQPQTVPREEITGQKFSIDRSDYVAFGTNQFIDCDCPIEQTPGLDPGGSPLAGAFDDRMRERSGLTAGMVRKDVARQVWENILDNLEEEVVPGAKEKRMRDRAKRVHETVF